MRRASCLLLVLMACAISLSQASDINQLPKRFESLGGEDRGSFRSTEFGDRSDVYSTTDNWLGGFGSWSNAGYWSAGLPGINSDVYIVTSNALVTLDTSASINSLTLGGLSGYADVIGAGYSYDIDIAGALTINPSGSFQMSEEDGFTTSTLTAASLANAGYFGVDGYATVGHLVNTGEVYVSYGSTLKLTNQPGGITDVPFHSGYAIQGTFVANNNNAFANLTSIEGAVDLESGQITKITPNGGGLTITGSLDNYGPLQIFGNVNNQGHLLDYEGLTTVTGSLTNSGLLANYSLNPMRMAALIQLAGGTIANYFAGPGQFGTFQATGDVSLDGTLEIVAGDGQGLPVGTSYKFLLFTPGDLTGAFSNVIGDTNRYGRKVWGVTYDNADGFVEITYLGTPEPGSMLLFGSGLIGFAGLRYRKKIVRGQR